MSDEIRQPSEKTLRRGYWIATHQEELRRDVVIGVGSVVGLIVAIALLMLGRYLIQIPMTNRVDAALVSPIISLPATRIPQGIVVSESTAVAQGNNTIGVLVYLKNPNAAWNATSIEYEVFAGASAVPMSIETLAPNQEKVLLATDVPFSGTSLPAVRVTVKKVVWKKTIDIAQRPTQNWTFVKPDLRAIAGTSSSSDLPYQSELAVTVRNGSVYGYKNVSVVAIIPGSDGKPKAAARILLDRITSLESRDLVFRFSSRLIGSVQPQIFVNTDLVNEDRLIRDIVSD